MKIKYGPKTHTKSPVIQELKAHFGLIYSTPNMGWTGLSSRRTSSRELNIEPVRSEVDEWLTSRGYSMVHESRFGLLSPTMVQRNFWNPDTKHMVWCLGDVKNDTYWRIMGFHQEVPEGHDKLQKHWVSFPL